MVANGKCLSGRDRRPSKWISWLYPRLFEECDRLRKIDLKLDASPLHQVAVAQLKPSGTPFGATSVDKQGVLLLAKSSALDSRIHGEALHCLAGTCWQKASGDEKQLQIEQEVACHLGELKRGFEAGTIDENTTENIDKTHFVIDFDNVSTLEYSGEKKMKYADAVSGGEGMVVVVRISGGSSRYIHPPMTIFTNIHGSYPIRGVVDSVEGGCYRAGPKQGGWIGVCFANTLQRGELWWRIGGDVRRQYFGGNCSGHLDEDEYYDGLYQLKAQLRFLPANTTDLGQPADSFVIVKTKDVLAHRWNENRLERIENNA